MDYEDLSGAGQSTPTPPSRPASGEPGARGSGPGSGGTDPRRVLLFAMLSGLAVMVAILLVVGLPIWIVAVIIVADIVAMRVMFSRLPPAR